MSVRADVETLRSIPIFSECDAVHLQLLAFSAVFSIVNPLGAAPIFLAMSADLPAQGRRHLATVVARNAFLLLASYFFYRANNYINNSTVGMPYGAEADEHGITASLVRRIARSAGIPVFAGLATPAHPTVALVAQLEVEASLELKRRSVLQAALQAA